MVASSGATRRTFEGVLGNLRRRLNEHQRRQADEGESDDGADTVAEFQRYMSRNVCPECEGTRLRREGLARARRWQADHRTGCDERWRCGRPLRQS